MIIEGGWVYPENMEDVRALGVILDGDEFEVMNRIGKAASHWEPYDLSIGKAMAAQPNCEIEPLASRRPLHLYRPTEPAEAIHFL